ncbi:MAG: hypothetical protein KDH96_11455 [Candidatus Riesia sp.]|nr:hypothetical protein [Candidatus Riesia sp.]
MPERYVHPYAALETLITNYVERKKENKIYTKKQFIYLVSDDVNDIKIMLQTFTGYIRSKIKSINYYVYDCMNAQMFINNMNCRNIDSYMSLDKDFDHSINLDGQKQAALSKIHKVFYDTTSTLFVDCCNQNMIQCSENEIIENITKLSHIILDNRYPDLSGMNLTPDDVSALLWNGICVFILTKKAAFSLFDYERHDGDFNVVPPGDVIVLNSPKYSHIFSDDLHNFMEKLHMNKDDSIVCKYTHKASIFSDCYDKMTGSLMSRKKLYSNYEKHVRNIITEVSTSNYIEANNTDELKNEDMKKIIDFLASMNLSIHKVIM